MISNDILGLILRCQPNFRGWFMVPMVHKKPKKSKKYVLLIGGLLDISTARYFYKVPKTILHQPTANSGINILYNKCLYKHYLQLL